MPDYKDIYYPESRFGGYTDVDGTIAFHLRVNALLSSTFVVLDVGCGRGTHLEDPIPLRGALRNLRGRCRRVIGIDIDADSGARNPSLDEFRPIEGPIWPIDAESIDLALADCVLEHVANPVHFFSEIARVIRPGGYVCLRTPNLLSYFGLASYLTPNRFHAAVAATVQVHRASQDVFPTLYRCNTKRRLERLLDAHGFEHHVYGYESEPSYLAFSQLAYLLGVLHQRFAPRALSVVLFGFARKQCRS